MDSAYNEDNIEAVLLQIRQIIEIRRQLQAPPPTPPSMWESWLDKASPGIHHAILIDTLWPVGFWWTVLRFCVLKPFLMETVIRGVFNVYSKDVWTADTAREYVDALLVISGFAATHLLYNTLYFLFVSTRYLLGFVWRYPAFVFTICGLLIGLTCLVRILSVKITDIGWKFINQVLSLSLWMTRLHFKGLVLCRKLWALIKSSSGIRIWKLCLRYCTLRILQRPTFDELDPFAYTPLLSEQRQIRLLRLTRQNPILDIQAELVCCFLDNAPSYEAISYVWGKEAQKEHHVILDGKRFSVSTNVYQILRGRGSVFGSRLIWIDSLCINQSDKVEKSEQVKMMRDIYNKASHVSICLGENPDAWLAWRMLTHFVHCKTFLTKEGFADQLFVLSKTKDTNISAQLTAFIDLLDHSWFNRVWVVQEVVVARSANILYGNSKLSWEQFIQVMDILFNPGIDGISQLLQHTGEGGVTRPLPVGPTQAAFMHVYREKFRRGQASQLYETLRIFQAFQATEPRDKIFALLELTESASELNHIISYIKPLPEILIEVADDILEKGHLFEVLHLAGIGWDEARTDIPSWVVDWSISREPVTLAHSFVDDELQYRAAVQRVSEISRGINERNIRLRGQFIDCIREMGLIMDGVDLNARNRPLESADKMVAWFEEAEDLLNKHAAAPYHNGQDLPQALWRTLIGDRTKEARPAPAAYETTFEKQKLFIHAVRDLTVRCGTDFDIFQECPPEFNPLLSLFPDWDSMRLWITDMSSFTWLCGVPAFPRKLAITSNGYIAMVPKGTESTDVICAIWGAPVPFVLRPHGNTANGEIGAYKLVGECYVHGMMDGECFELPFEDFIFEIV